jgi:spore germination protein
MVSWMPMSNPSAIVLSLAVLTLAVPGALRASQAGSLQSSAWLVYWDLDRGGKTIQDLRGRLDEICLFAYHFDSQGHLIPASDAVPDQLRTWKALQISGRPRLWITVVNDKVSSESSLFKDPAVVHQVLADLAARQSHIQELLDLSKGADGLEIDYENLDANDRGAFSQFLRELSPPLHARGQYLSVVLEPRTQKQEQAEGPGAMDWEEIAQHADRIRVMAYFLHYGGGVSGPTAPPGWVGEILEFAVRRIPREKLDIAFCLDGIDWPSDRTGSEVPFNQIEELRTRYKKPLLRSGRGQPPHFSYQEGKDIHQVWYEDASSLREKVRRVRAAGLTRVSFWRLGTGDPNFWKWLAAQKGRPRLRK